MIRKATQADYNRLVRSIQTVTKHSPYITTKQLKQDIEQGACYLKEDKGMFVAVISLIYDRQRELHYLKRLSIPNKKNRGKGYAQEMIRFFQDMPIPKIAITPWAGNPSMLKIASNLNFKFQYIFLKEYCFYIYEKRD